MGIVDAGIDRVQRYILDLEEPAAWDANGLSLRRQNWEFGLDARTQDGVANTVTRAVERLGHWQEGAPVEQWVRLASPLADFTRRFMASVEGGAGIALLRNLPLLRPQAEVQYNEDLLWVLTCLVGRPVNQNGRGQLLAHVRDLGDPHRGRDVRPEDTNDPLKHHTDGSDVIFLMCVRQAVRGGNSFISSSVRTVREIARRYPELLPVLFEVPFAFDRNEEQPIGDHAFYTTRLCTIVDGRISVRYSREMIETAQEAPGVPPLTASQCRVMDVFDEIAAEGGTEVDFRSGDLMVMNNYSVLHARAPFEDVEEVDERRLLLRTWIAMWRGRPLPFDFDRGVNTDGVGRGGVPFALPGSLATTQ